MLRDHVLSLHTEHCLTPKQSPHTPQHGSSSSLQPQLPLSASPHKAHVSEVWQRRAARIWLLYEHVFWAHPCRHGQSLFGGLTGTGGSSSGRLVDVWAVSPLAAVIRAAANEFIELLFCVPCYTPGSEIARQLHVKTLFNFPGNCQMVSHTGCLILCPHQRQRRVPVSLCPANRFSGFSLLFFPLVYFNGAGQGSRKPLPGVAS